MDNKFIFENHSHRFLLKNRNLEFFWDLFDFDSGCLSRVEQHFVQNVIPSDKGLISFCYFYSFRHNIRISYHEKRNKAFPVSESTLTVARKKVQKTFCLIKNFIKRCIWRELDKLAWRFQSFSGAKTRRFLVKVFVKIFKLI